MELSTEENYKQVTVRLFHKGVVLRGEQPGSMIRTSRQWRVRVGQVLLSRIDARNGAIGLVPAELDGAIVTNDFWAFDVNRDLADPRFLDLYFGTRQFVDSCQRASEGTTNRVRLQPNRFLHIEVPLPRVQEQRRIVARIEELSAKIEEARRLRSRSLLEFEAFLPSARNNVVAELRHEFDDVQLFKITDGPHVSPRYVENGIPFISVRNITEAGLDFTTAKYISPEDHEMYSKKANVESGDLLYTKGGTTGVARRVDTNRPFSIWVHVALLKLNRNVAEAGFVEHMLNTPSSKEQAEQYTRGSSNRDLGLNRMSNILFPLPPLEQRHIVAYLDDLQAKVNNLKTLQEETAKELDSLMPSILSKAFSGISKSNM